MYQGEGTKQQLTSAPVPAIKQGEEKTVVMPLDYDGKMPSISFRLDNNKDFDPSNDELKLVLWEPLPTAYDGPDPNVSDSAISASTKVPLELKVTIAGQPVSQYKILDAFTNRLFARVVNGEQYGSLRSGTYHVSVQPYSGEGQEVLFEQDIQHKAGTLQEVDLKSGIKIEPPEVAQKLWRWGVSRADDQANTVQWQTGSHAFVVLPPGDYQVHSSAVGAENSWIEWPQSIRVQPNQSIIVRIDNSVRLEMATSLGNFWRWQLIKSGRPDQVVASQYGEQHEMIVPPGNYQLATSAVGSENQWIIWPQKVEVQAGSGTVLKIDSSMHLDLAPELGDRLWRWEVTRFDKPDQIIQSQYGDQRTVILPPGDYQIISSAKGSENQWIVWPQKVQVRAGQQSTLRIDTSLGLNLPPEARNLLWRWQVIRFGRPDEKIQSQYGDQNTVVLPAGEYQVLTSAKGAENQWISWPQRITVQPGRQAEVNLNSGIRLTGPAAPGALFKISDANGRTVQSWQGNAVQLLPPSKYTVEARPDSASEWKRVGENLEVRQGGFTEVNVPSLAKSGDQGNSGFHH